MTLKLRAATSSDIDSIAALHAESWRHNYRGTYPVEYLDKEVGKERLTVWRNRLNSPPANQHVTVVESDSRIAGFICIYGDEDTEWGSLVDNLHVITDLKRGGIGTLLMREGARWLEEHYPQSPVYLWVLETNTPARRFYERLGGKDMGAVPQPIAGGGSAMSCRQTWSSPDVLFKNASAFVADRTRY